MRGANSQQTSQIQPKEGATIVAVIGNVDVILDKGRILFQNENLHDGPYTLEQLADMTSSNPDEIFTGIAARIHADKAVIWRKFMGVTALLHLRDPYRYVMDVFATEIKLDPRATTFSFLGGISAYTDNPLNIGVLAPTSEGKTFVVVQVLKHFPKNDVWFLGGLSPKALAHQHGTLIDIRDRQPIESKYAELRRTLFAAKLGKNVDEQERVEREIEDLRQYEAYLIDLRFKILVFLEPPHKETWQMLKPLQSHDVWEYEYRIVDKDKSGRNYTKLTILRGWPATIFCSAKDVDSNEASFWHEIESRFLTISPEMGPAKYRAAIEQLARMKGLPGIATRKLIHIEEHNLVAKYIQRVRDHWRQKLDSPDEPESQVWNPYASIIGKKFPANAGRNMRDAGRFLSTMNSSALAFPFHRPHLKFGNLDYILVARGDFERALFLFFGNASIETLFTGLPAHILTFYENVVKPLCLEAGSVRVSAMVDKYRQIYEKSLSSDSIRHAYLDRLASCGYVDSEPDPNDKRAYLWRVIDTDDKNRNSPILQDSSNFTLEQLRQAYNELQAITENEGQFVGPNNEPLQLEEIYQTYFLTSTNPTAFSVIDSARKIDDQSLDRTELDDSCNIVDNPNLKDKRKETLLRVRSLHFSEPEDYVEYLVQSGMTREEAAQLIKDAITRGVMAKDSKSGKFSVLLHVDSELPELLRVGGNKEEPHS